MPLLLVDGPPNRAAFLSGFWQWVELLASGDDARAVEALWWSLPPADPSVLVNRYRTFWSGDEPWHVVVPNTRLVSVVNDAAQTEFPDPPKFHDEAVVGWGMAQVPVTTTPERAKADDVVLMGVATSLFMRRVEGRLAFQFEIIHA